MASTLELMGAANNAFWGNTPTATLIMTSAWSLGSQSITSPTLTAPWQSSNVDNWSGHSNVTNNTRYTIQVAGTYLLTATLNISGNATGQRFACFFRNGTAIPQTIVETGAQGTNPVPVQVPAWFQPCAVGDYLEVGASQNSGSTLNVGLTNGASGISGNWFTIQFMHF